MKDAGKDATVEEYLDEIAEEYEHDMQWLLSKKPYLNAEAQNSINRLNSSIRVAIQNIGLLKNSIKK